MAKKEKCKKTGCYIGGQAVLEGVMMMGKTCMATAVRDPDGEIQIEALRLNKSPAVQKIAKIPLIRGCVNLFSSLTRGTKTLMRSAAVYGDEGEEASGFEKWLASKFKVNLMDVVTVISTILGIGLAVALFMILPNVIVSGLCKLIPAIDETAWEFVILGVIKLAIFLVYLGLILLLKDIRRLYMYHGAEHKTITCYEYGLDLTPENAKKCTRIHDRCGTSFMFIVLFINIVILSLVQWLLGVHLIESGIYKALAKIGIEIVLLPVIAGFSYEVLKFLAKFDNPFVKIFKAPGMFIQKVFTTREPEPEMLEVAIAAFKKVLEMDADPSIPECKFVTGGILGEKLEETKKLFKEREIDESDAEWIYSLILNVKRSEFSNETIITAAQAKKLDKVITERLTGKPLWYVIGDTEFYDCKIKVDERMLIPRPETELLAELAVKNVKAGDKVLDMCTGSGCIAISVAKHCQDKNVKVTAVDISFEALSLASENAEENQVRVNFIQSDMFASVSGKYNLIVSNPPYVPTEEIALLQTEVKNFEPKKALDGGNDGLNFYRTIAQNIGNYLVEGGILLLECGENQPNEIVKLFAEYKSADIIKDLYGVERFIKIAF